MTLTTSLAVAGGGLAGLHAAGLLERAGLVDVVLLESRRQIGGRLLPTGPSAVRGHFYPGATWVWPGMQAELGRLLVELGLALDFRCQAGGRSPETLRARRVETSVGLGQARALSIQSGKASAAAGCVILRHCNPARSESFSTIPEPVCPSVYPSVYPWSPTKPNGLASDESQAVDS